jgi:hypothetical protein
MARMDQLFVHQHGSDWLVCSETDSVESGCGHAIYFVWLVVCDESD